MVLVEEVKSKRELKEIPISLIASSTKPSREIFEDIDALASTIRRHGLIQPIVVRKDIQRGWVVVVGERRFQASKRAGLTKVPCIIVDDSLTEEQILEMQLTENVARADLKIFEQIKIVQTLRNEFGLSLEEISIRSGLSRGTVENYLLIAQKLPWGVIKLIAHGSHSPVDLTITKALILARAGLPQDRLKEVVELIRRPPGLSTATLARKLAQRPSISKIKRVRESRVYWRELTKTVRDYASYWSDFAQLKEWETISHYHMQLNISLPKNLKESED